MNTTKVCPGCKVEKPLDAFGKNNSKPDKKQGYCRECKRAYDANWRAENPEKKRAGTSQYANLY